MIETIYSNPDELYHHGVKGMKWGVRHDPEQKRIGAREENTGYKYNKPGESGWVGMRRAIKARRSESRSKKESVKEAKKDYKAAKKAYNKSFNKWYYSIHNSPVHITKEGKRINESNFQKSLVSAGELAIQKGKYLQAKGVAKNHPKTVAKGKHIVTTASNTKKYHVKVSSLIDKGYSSKEAHKQLSVEYDRAVNRQIKEDARYKKEMAKLKKG